MSVINVKSALALGAGAVIPAVTGTVTSVWPLKGGNSQRDGKPYTVQSLILDNEGTTARVTLWNKPDVQSLKGQQAIFASVKGGNGRLSGVMVEMGKDKDGQPRLEIKVNDNAQVHTAESYAEVSGQAVPTVPVANIQPQSPLPGSLMDTVPAAATASSHAVATQGFVAPAKPSLDDMVALFGQCFRAAKFVMYPEGKAEGATLQAVQAGTATLFITAKDNGLAFGAAKRDASTVGVTQATKTESNPF
jgi:hypothetical protein